VDIWMGGWTSIEVQEKRFTLQCLNFLLDVLPNGSLGSTRYDRNLPLIP
jgi:hypothetical protein